METNDKTDSASSENAMDEAASITASNDSAEASADLPSTLPPPNNASAHEEITERADTVWVRGTGPRISKKDRYELRGPGGRVAIIDGCRTPFAKAGSELKNLDCVDLGAVAARELVARTAVEPGDIDLSIFGVVVPALNAPNLGREVIFRASLPETITGTTVNLACASSNRAIAFGAQAILSGEAEIVLAGGAESLSNVPITYSRNAAQQLMKLSKAKSVGAKLGALGKLRFKDLAPVAPAIAEYTTGMT
ncbi:MAG: beta-ketoacyl synthase N-terminal-like domain-containing protein, partial [Acidobacteriota bacterium]|nr:beta-ketoacyl synthase N-terminal-like domain-containing protein [Acidobacteriota bacterium]